MALFDPTTYTNQEDDMARQQQQQQQPPRPPHAGHSDDGDGFSAETVLCVPEDHKRYLPRRMRAPGVLPRSAPLPRAGEVIYLSAGNAWAVQMVVHSWLDHGHLRIEVWIEHIRSSRQERPTGFALTQ